MKKVSILCPYPIGLAPSQRFRIEMFVLDAKNEDLDFSLKPFFSEKAYNNLYQPGKTVYKIIQVAIGYLKRIIHIFECIGADYVLVHREAAPLGPAIFEWILAKVMRKKIIFDFDDAIWLANTSDQNKLSSGLKWNQKFAAICKWSYKIAAGNEFLVKKASENNSNVILIPTVVDTETKYIPKKTQSEKITIGWTGSHSTSPFLEPLIPLLRKLQEELSFRFLFISNQPPDFSLPDLVFKKWNKTSEIADLNEIDIGIMPLTINDWARGKCGFKLIQYQALGIPAVSTDIPPNDKIVLNSESGFLCKDEKDWHTSLKELIKNESLRKKFGENGRKHIEANYSKKAHIESFFNLFS